MFPAAHSRRWSRPSRAQARHPHHRCAGACRGDAARTASATARLLEGWAVALAGRRDAHGANTRTTKHFLPQQTTLHGHHFAHHTPAAPAAQTGLSSAATGFSVEAAASSASSPLAADHSVLCDSGTFLPLRVVVLSVPMVSPPPRSRPALAAHCPGAGSGGGGMSPRQPELGPILRGKQSFVRRHPTLYGQHVSKSTKRQIERCQRD